MSTSFWPQTICSRYAPQVRIGYRRVSTRDQNPRRNTTRFSRPVCEQMFIDKAPRKLARRPELEKATAMHQPDGQKPAPGWAGLPLARGMRPVGGSGAAAGADTRRAAHRPRHARACPSALSGKRKLYGARSSVPRSYRFAKVKRRLDGVIILSPSGRTGRPFPTDRLPAGTS